jgi:hypothetical protein
MIISDLWYNFTKETLGLSLFFFGWPFLVAFYIFFIGTPKGKKGLSNLLKALYYSWATYLGVGDTKLVPTRFKWRKSHRLVGIFGIAYIVGIFIFTII